jgi:hypothetical protein
MADLVITAADVLKYSGAKVEVGTAGEAIIAGKIIHRHTDSTMLLADSSTAIKARAVGMALTSAALGQPLLYSSLGGVDPGATVAVGEVYTVSSTPGGIGPVGDRAAGEYITLLGFGMTDSRIDLRIVRGEVAIPAA